MREMIPFLQVRSNSIVLYNQPAIPHRKASPLDLPSAYSGNITSGAVRRMRKAIDILLQKSPGRMIYNPVSKRKQPFRLGFVTLTIPLSKPVPAKWGNRYLLKPFIRSMEAQGKLSYIWKAELQKRGQLHYHITWNQFRDWSFIRNKWNRVLRKHRLLDDYALKHGHFDPNSTDVHSVKKIRNFEAYLFKYISKNTGGKLNGKVWDCSIDLKTSRYSSIMTFDNDDRIREVLKSGKAKCIKLDHCTIIKCKNPLEILSIKQQHEYDYWAK